MTTARKRPARPLPVRIHRWISLAVAAFWLIQAATGVLSVFHWELEDAGVAGAHSPTDLAAIDRRLGALAPEGSGRRIISVWTTAGAPDRYDVTVAEGERERAVRVAGDGTVLRDKGEGERGTMGTIVAIHQELLAGDAGGWIVGISGLLLCTNLILGLVLAWPKRGFWRRSLTPVGKGPLVGRLYSWHRAIGLWAAVPALFLVGAGVLLKFEDGTAKLIGAEPVAAPPVSAFAGRPVGFAVAARAAIAAVPGSRLTAVAMPAGDKPVYRVRVLAPGERRRAYGTTTIFVDARTGTALSIARADAAPPTRAFMDGLYAVHTGEFGGLAGRLLVLALGLWLAAMIVMGVLLWWRRRPRNGPSRLGRGRS